jgi:hypothetical protein
MQTQGFVDPSRIESAFSESTGGNMNETYAGGRHPSVAPVGDAVKAPGFIRTAISLYKDQGLCVFCKGLSLNLVKGPITVGISFTTYDIFLEDILGCKKTIF